MKPSSKPRITIDQIGDRWFALEEETEVAWLEFFEDDDGRAWLIGAETLPEYRRKGLATRIMLEAVDSYGEVFASLATQFEHEQCEGDWDVRWLTSDGRAFVRACVAMGIMRKEWLVHPFEAPTGE